MKILALVALSIAYMTAANAAAQELTITKLNDDRTKIITSFSGSAPNVGQEFVFKDEFDQECRAKVTKVSSTALLETVHCPNGKGLKVGDKLAAAAPAIEPPPTRVDDGTVQKTARSASEGLRFSAFVLLNTARNMSFPSAKYNNGTSEYDGTANWDGQAAFGVGAEVMYTRIGDWGWSAGFDYEFKREFDHFDFSGGGVFANASLSPKPHLTVATIYGNAVYRWDTVYLPFGLNYAVLADFKNTSGIYSGTIDTKGTLGFQVGVGFNITELIALELNAKATGLRQDLKGGAVTYNMGTGFLTGVQGLCKFRF